jgi:hypothetical protein
MLASVDPSSHTITHVRGQRITIIGRRAAARLRIALLHLCRVRRNSIPGCGFAEIAAWNAISAQIATFVIDNEMA